MPVPNRGRNKDGRWRKKRSDTGKPRGFYKTGESEGSLPDNREGLENGEDHKLKEVDHP